MPKRIYVVATGQAQANLPPIFSIAQRGDTVVWIETQLAEHGHYSGDSIPLLRNSRGIESEKLRVTESDILNPERMKQVLLTNMKDRDADPVFIATGGPKYMIFGIDRAAVELGFPVVYSDVQPARLLTLAHPSASFTLGQFQNPITLHEWLAVNRLALCSTYPEPIPIWPAASHGLHPGRDLSFSTDLACQRTFFAIHQAKAAAARKKSDPDPDVPNELTATPAFRNAWAQLLRDFFKHPTPYENVNSPFFNRLRKFFLHHAKLASTMLQPALTLDPACVQHLKDDAWLDPAFDPAAPGAHEPESAAGDRFEEAVALRVARFMQHNPGIASTVSGVFLNVSLAAPSDPKIRFSQLDVAILLKNATLIHIECKCGRETSESDTYQRLGKLQRAGQTPATLVFCIPMFPALVDDPVFQYLYRPFHRITGLRAVNPKLGLLFYTNPDESTERECRLDDGEPFTVTPFEHGLFKLLHRYVPEPETSIPVAR